VAILRPFRAFRPPQEHAPRVASRPYDVLSSEEARAEVQGNPDSFLRIGKPEVDLPPGTDLYSAVVYETAQKNFADFIRRGLLVKDAHPSLYIYAQTWQGKTQYGIAGCASVDEYQSGGIKRHELTRPDKEDDRMRHILTTGAQTGPIFLTYRRVDAIDAAVADEVSSLPAVEFTAQDGVKHAVWVVDEERRVKGLTDLFAAVPALYIADGHHRSAAAVRAAHACRNSDGGWGGNEEYNFFLSVVFPHNQLRILPYYRVVKDLNGRNAEEFMAEVTRHFAVSPSPGPVDPPSRGTYGMFLGGRWYRLTLRSDLLDRGEEMSDRLDVALLQEHFLKPVLGIEDPRRDKRIDFVGGIRGLGELERLVREGKAVVAISMHPTSVDELMQIADEGEIMPPKSTWFEPKLRDGLLVHALR
jgi:uncharacterized protein (DUF1015 family)